MSFIHCALNSEYHAENTYVTVELPEDKSLNDFREDWLKVRANMHTSKDSIDKSIYLLKKLGYKINNLDIYYFFECEV